MMVLTWKERQEVMNVRRASATTSRHMRERGLMFQLHCIYGSIPLTISVQTFTPQDAVYNIFPYQVRRIGSTSSTASRPRAKRRDLRNPRARDNHPFRIVTVYIRIPPSDTWLRNPTNMIIRSRGDCEAVHVGTGGSCGKPCWDRLVLTVVNTSTLAAARGR